MSVRANQANQLKVQPLDQRHAQVIWGQGFIYW